MQLIVSSLTYIIMKKILINYNFTPDKSWIGDDYLIYDRSDDGLEHLDGFDSAKIIKTENRGNVDYDKLNYIIDNYDKLPDVFLWGKTNLFKYLTREEYEEVKDNKVFTPLLTQNHRQYQDNNSWVAYYNANMYHERNDNWYFYQFASRYVNSFDEWCRGFQLPKVDYIPFAPGGNYILTRDTVHKYAKDYYVKMASLLPYCQLPVEACCAERSYYLMFK
jgi:hypothetical protein